ncbi:hypothetical protein P3S68_031465 [Capsicum galapagoense]
MAGPIWDIAILCDTMRELQSLVNDLLRESVIVRARMLREILRLMRDLLLLLTIGWMAIKMR